MEIPNERGTPSPKPGPKWHGPTVLCHIKDDPYLLKRSYLSKFKDATGKRVMVHDTGNRKSQAKRRRIARRRNTVVRSGH